MNQSEVMDVLERHGAALKGHFLLSSGRHSDVFVQKFRVLEHPGLAQRFGDSIARSFDGEFDAVAAPAVGAVVLGFCTALAAGTRFVFAERTGDKMVFRRGFELGSRTRTLVVEDVITTGGSAAEVVDLVRASGAQPIGIGALIDRGDPARATSFGVPLRALVSLQVGSWEVADCPLCAADVPLDDPGSRRLKS